jgi:hypothetical protein
VRARRRGFKIAQDRPLSTRDRRLIGAVDALAFLEAEDRFDDARCEQRRIITAFEHEDGPAVAILGSDFSHDSADLTRSRFSESKIADRIAGNEIITGADYEQVGPYQARSIAQRLRPNRNERI